VNLFGGLLLDARTGGTMGYERGSRDKPGRPALIVPIGAKQGRHAVWSSFPVTTFEAALTRELMEVQAADVFGESEAGRKVEAISGRLVELDALVKQWTAKMEDPAIVDTVAAKLADLNTRRKTLAADLAAAQQEAASPAAESWGEFRTLGELLASDPSDELRVKVRAALRRSVERVYCLFVGRTPVRFARVQVVFKGGAARTYVIRHTQTVGNGKKTTPGGWDCFSLDWEPGESLTLDLRNPDHVRELVRVWESKGTAAAAGWFARIEAAAREAQAGKKPARQGTPKKRKAAARTA
jgi:hypothetical protein